ncbi:NAD-binding protein [Fomitiporia mediterranea MF3/22]|uniref:NAD-binding protein n=1 Tax=Fomitiporia mediterranea (strain MF3/22) TaxID=694068 RepID=UPI0004408B07|nr:NAD-binding protein [Fomitiporia mediterranea MF3/22]EJD07388.1 NAD-binding protein [Fomitiporia mediterranea MF3/22]
MAQPTPFVLKWGIVSTGKIAACFVRDLLIDPKTRDVHDVVHKIVAVGSRSVDSARKFIDDEIKDSSVKAYGSYDELFADQNVDAVYIGTPHTLHYTNSKSALLAGKHVLCEKPVTSNSAELRSLLTLAKEKKRFFMEALWTRFQPLVNELKKVAEEVGGDGERKLGDPVVMHADLAGDFDIEDIPKTHRILDPKLGGGALLDLGPYPMVWAIIAMYEHPKNNRSRPSNITGSMLKTPLTDVDLSTSFTLTFSPSSSSSQTNQQLLSQAILTCNITLPPLSPSGVIIRYRNGTIHVSPPIFSPRSFTVQYFDKPGSGTVIREEKHEVQYIGVGWHFQADEVAKCVRDGKVESGVWSHEMSLLEMDVFDEVRRQGGYVFPPGVEQVV